MHFSSCISYMSQMCTKAAHSTWKPYHRMKFEVFHHDCDKSGCVRCVVANGFFMFSIDLQGLSPQLQFDYQFVCAKRREVEETERKRVRGRMNHMLKVQGPLFCLENCSTVLVCRRENKTLLFICATGINRILIK